MNMLLAFTLALVLGALRCQCWRTHVPNQKIVTQVLPQNYQFIQKGQIVQNETSSHVIRNDSATPRFLITNNANIPVNVLAVTNILGTAVVKNRMGTGSQMSFEAGKPGQWNFEILVDDGEFYWERGEERTWKVAAQVATYGANQIVKAVLSGHTLSWTIGTAVGSTLATVVAAPVALAAGAIAFAATYGATSMTSTLLYDVTKSYVQHYGSLGMKRRHQKLALLFESVDKRVIFPTIPMKNQWVPLKDIADERSVQGILKASARMRGYDSTYDSLMISKADAVSYLRAVDSTFRSSWYVKPDLLKYVSKGRERMDGSRAFTLLGGFQMPAPGDVIVKWVGLSIKETLLPEKLRGDP